MSTQRLSPVERLVFWASVCLMVFGALGLLYRVNRAFLVTIPGHGGTFNEGIVGSPHLPNPLFATTDTDKDVSTLVYAGLMKWGPRGTVLPDLAESYTLSKDGKTYTFTLKPNVFFHDGVALTAEDIAFTINLALDPNLKSPRRVNWEGVTVAVLNDHQIQFTLRLPYAPFLQNATLGILPKHLWNSLDPEQFTFSRYMIEPVGAGPYALSQIQRSADGIPTSYVFTPFNRYAGTAPLIGQFSLKFYPSLDEATLALRGGAIDALGSVPPASAKDFKKLGMNVAHAALPRVFGVFFNQVQAPLFANKEVRQALTLITDRQAIVDTVLYGFGTPLTVPVPESLIDISTSTLPTQSASTSLEQAKNLLGKSGWTSNAQGILTKIATVRKGKKNTTTTQTLSFSLATINAPDLVATANILKTQWAKLGVNVDIKVFEVSDFNQLILRPRKYDAVLFGEVIGRDMDLYAFWHSSQRSDPGLNIALYASSHVDKLLTAIRTETDANTRQADLQSLNKEITTDIPALFLYTPDFIYVLPPKATNVSLGPIFNPSERFMNVSEWYVDTDEVWPIFINKKN